MNIQMLLGCLILCGSFFAGCGNDTSPNSTAPVEVTPSRSADSLVLSGVTLQIPDSGRLYRRVSVQISLNSAIKDSVHIEEWAFAFFPACSLKVVVRWQPTSPYAYAVNSTQQALLASRIASDSAPWRDSGKIFSGVGNPGFDGRAALIANSSEAVGVLAQCPESSPLVGELDGILQSIKLTRP